MFDHVIKNKSILVKVLLIVCSLIIGKVSNAEDQKKQYLEKTISKNGIETRKVFQPVIKKVLQSTFKIQSEGKDSAFGVVVTSDGLAVTKLSEINQELVCTFADGKTSQAEIVYQDKKQDIAILQLKGGPFDPVKWSKEKPQVGQWVAVPGLEKIPEAIGIVSGDLQRVAKEFGVFGVSLNSDKSELRVSKVFPGTGASQAKIQKNDVILSFDDKNLESKLEFRKSLYELRAGDSIRVRLFRDSKELEMRVTMGYPTGNVFSRMNFQNQMGGYLSNRRSGFASVFSHDAILAANQCGGVLVNLDGEAVGMNIARAGRTETYALPASIVLDVIKQYQESL